MRNWEELWMKKFELLLVLISCQRQCILKIELYVCSFGKLWFSSETEIVCNEIYYENLQYLDLPCLDKLKIIQKNDTAGQERFRSLIPSYIWDSSVAFIVYDVAIKWSKGKQKKKVNNLVLFDKSTYDKLLCEAPKYKLITPSVLSDRLRAEDDLMVDTHELGGSAVVVDRATTKENDYMPISRVPHGGAMGGGDLGGG
ncbi:hypothetical protein CASFOL_017917 [Castilleja foliolosa]|uniref:Uncharacterized protein n=1 Tax=Castilleja foliolosa TaxID=1961234 RepID=A0ABD3DC63_9LAMI